MRRLKILAACVALAATCLPQGASAFNGDGCARTSAQGSKRCAFSLTGTPLIVYAESSATDARVRVWVTPQGSPEVVLVECSARGPGFASCSDSFPDDTTAVALPDHPLVGVAMTCHFEGSGPWAYSCSGGVA